MNYFDKPILTDSGDDLAQAKFGWIPAMLLAFTTLTLRLHELYGQRRFMMQNYWLWYDAPIISYAPDIRVIAGAVFVVAVSVATCFAIRKNEIHVHADFCIGRAFKTWGLLPKAREFHLQYDEIKSMKVQKKTLSIRTAEGKYRVFVENPQTCYDYIEKRRAYLS